MGDVDFRVGGLNDDIADGVLFCVNNIGIFLGARSRKRFVLYIRAESIIPHPYRLVVTHNYAPYLGLCVVTSERGVVC